MRTTPLTTIHQELGAKMANFAGFNMPISYSSIKEEVKAVREDVGVFDVSHMGEFFITGKDSVKFVDYLITNDFQSVENLKAVYSPLCNNSGKIIDDLIAYKISSEQVMICVNAANIEKDWQHIEAESKKFDVKLVNKSDQFSLLALQGPKSEEILIKLGLLAPSTNFPYYSVLEKDNTIIARTGYTGEDGFEIFCPNEDVLTLWQKMIDLKVLPCGLASRDVLRLEVCYPLYGHELNDELTPLDTGLKWTVKMDKDNFIGKEFLSNHKPSSRLVKLSLDKGIPRDGYLIEDETGQEIGLVTSGTMSTTLNRGICMARIKRDLFPKSKQFYINIRGKKLPAKYHKTSFVEGGHK